MPEWLRRKLKHGARITITNKIGQDGRLIPTETIANEYRDIIPVLMQLCEQDPSVSRVYFCNPNVVHVVKMAKEGGFCGYRNIQMMISYIRDARSEGHRKFPGRLPSVIKLQDMIEDAWEQGFNSIGKIETGGIRGTRKYIGTPEVNHPCCHGIPSLTSQGPSPLTELKHRVCFSDTGMSQSLLTSTHQLRNRSLQR